MTFTNVQFPVFLKSKRNCFLLVLIGIISLCVVFQWNIQDKSKNIDFLLSDVRRSVYYYYPLMIRNISAT